MKKLLAPILSLLLALPMAACGPQPEPPVTTIRPAVFSEDAQELLHDDVIFFDYTTDGTIRSVSTDIWKCQDGEWAHYGKTSGNIEPGDYRIGFRVTESGYDIFDINSSGSGKSSYTAPAPSQDFDACAMTVSTQLGDPTSIVCGEEITLWLKAGSNGDHLSTCLEDFRGSDCTAGLAVTITFSDAPLS